MYSHQTELRVRYAETDRMGYVYYGTYAQYLEVGRVEALRSLGFPYRAIEEGGVMLPVRDLTVRYFKPAFYDDLLIVSTVIPEWPGARIRFEYEIHDEQGQLITKADTTLVFIDRASGRPTRPPAPLLDRLSPYFTAR